MNDDLRFTRDLERAAARDPLPWERGDGPWVPCPATNRAKDQCSLREGHVPSSNPSGHQFPYPVRPR